MFLSAVDDMAVAVVATVAVCVLGAMFVFPGEAGALMVAIVFVASWAAIDTDAPTEQERDRRLLEVSAGEEADRPTRWVAALGDSFISGEGAAEFYSGTNTPGVNECHRAPTAWPDLFADDYAALLPDQDPAAVRLVSFACSGATITHVGESAQHPDATDQTGGGDSQLALFADWIANSLGDQDTVDYVLVSAGGNDAGFSKVIAACLMPAAECGDEIMVAFEQRAQSVDQDLASLLDAVVASVASDKRLRSSPPTVIVNPYLDPIGPRGGKRCSAGGVGSLLSEEELPTLRRFRGTLNGIIETVVDNHTNDTGVVVLYNSDGASVQGNLCGAESGDLERRQNWIVLQPPEGGFASLNPSTWVLGSLHPTAAGHEAIAAGACRLIESRYPERPASPVCPPAGDELKVGGEVAAPPEDRAAVVTALCGGEEVRDCTNNWVSDQLAKAALTLAGGAVLALTGGAIGGSYAGRFRERREVDPELEPDEPVPTPTSGPPMSDGGSESAEPSMPTGEGLDG